MDSYPEDLLVGVFPLVFAVDTTREHRNAEDELASSSISNSSRRSLFDRFLDAMAASLMEEEEAGGGNESTTTSANSDRRKSVSLFRSDDSDDDSDDDEGLLEEYNSHQRNNRRSFSSGIYPGFGRRPTTATYQQDAGSETHHALAVFAKALTSGQSFFERARIESVSAKHGFPPSKDPEGTNGLAYLLPQTIQRRNQDQMANIFEAHPVDGVLPAGWLEKHVHALPSVILVVCTVSASRSEQDEQDRRLYETTEHLRYSLVFKRNCTIHVVGLMDDEITQVQADIWSRTVISQMLEKEASPRTADPVMQVALLRASSDLQANDTGLHTSLALKQLHRTVRNASKEYYLGQARRTKEKLAKLRSLDSTKRGNQPASAPIQLLPLVVRYYFKIAMFYEFQWKHEKSLRYMSEGYKEIVKYYQYLISRSAGLEEDKLSVVDNHFDTHLVEDGLEVSISDTKRIAWSRVVPEPPVDMIEQCRAVADWMNLKILSAGLASRTSSGLLVAAQQWRHHSTVFCSHLMLPMAPSWRDWSYIARQRLIVSQLIERHPPTALVDHGSTRDEDLLRCSPWRNYESAAEAKLQLACAVQRATNVNEGEDAGHEDSEKGDPMRQKFVGGLGNDQTAPTLLEESRTPHRAHALELLLRAISLFERELETEKRGFYAEDEFSESSSSRTGARLYYLAGGLLLGMNRHEEAVSKLSKAAKFATGWKEIELAIRRLLIDCYEKHIPSQSDGTENSDALASMILDSYFNAEMSSAQLRRALDHFSSISGGGSLRWFHEASDDEMTRLPFSFAVSFPHKTHATAGDMVDASVLVRSNLDYAVHVKHAVLLSLAGELPIPANDLISATNASEGSEGGIIIQAKTVIVISTEIRLPKDTAVIAYDDSGNGGEQQAAAGKGKGSFAKSARPRTAGISAAGGARFVSEEKLEAGNRSSQGWNMNFLGGKTLRCDGLRVIFYPVQAEKTSSIEKVTLIELTIKKKKSRTEANIKRTPFEEENYIASAWSRPDYLPLSRGPRSLRVLDPAAHVVVSNLTEPFTQGKAIEGTINRIVLRLQGGAHERCRDMKIAVSCFSILVTPNGTTKRLVAREDLTKESENSVDMTDPSFRTPMLVCSGEGPGTTDLGYMLPPNWVPCGSGQSQAGIPIPELERGECSYVHLDLFRPAAALQFDVAPDESSKRGMLGDVSLCKTDIYATISYRQERPSSKKRRPTRRNIRRASLVRPSKAPSEVLDCPETQLEVPADEDAFDNVSLEYIGSVVWTSPLAASFTPGFDRSQPCGSRHPSNAVGEGSARVPDAEFALVDGQSVTMKCSLELERTMEELKTEVKSVRLMAMPEEDSPVEFLLSGTGGGNLLCGGDQPQRPCVLSTGSTLSVAYSVRAKLKPGFLCGGVSAFLGIVEVDWAPVRLSLPEETVKSSKSTMGSVETHGPLCLQSPSTMRFRGPPCYIERAPFEAIVTRLPSYPCVVTPFEVCYSVENKTDIHQLVTICLDTPPLDDASSSPRDGLFVSGSTNGELSLEPNECRTLSFTFLATRPGPLDLPGLCIASNRYSSWVVKEEGASRNQVYILP